VEAQKALQDTKNHGGGMMSAVKLLMRKEGMVYCRSQRAKMMKGRQSKTAYRLIPMQKIMLREL
jgi:hypothetical protein